MTTTTLNELTYRLIQLYRSNYKIDDSVPVELFEDWIHSTRAMLLKQRLSKPFTHYSQAIIQTLGPVELEQVESSIAGDTSGKYMLRTVRDIPLPINTPGNLGAFTRIGPADRADNKFKLVSYDTALFSGYGKFNSKDIHAFMLDGKIYITARNLEVYKLIEKIDIHGVFANPVSAALFKNPDWTRDHDYPVDKHLIDDMENIITKTKYPFILEGITDPFNNAKDDLAKPNINQQPAQ